MDLRVACCFEGNEPDVIDIFCLNEIYVPLVQNDLNRHYEGMMWRRKRRSTKNPNAPRGTRRPIVELTDGADHSLHVTTAEVGLMDKFITAYHGAAQEEPASPWERDPLTTDAQRAERARLVQDQAGKPAHMRYLAMRAATRAILGL